MTMDVSAITNALDNLSKNLGGYHPLYFALMLLFQGAVFWLLIFGKVGNPTTIPVTWHRIKDISNASDEHLFRISQYRHLAHWFDASLFKPRADNEGTSEALHVLWLGTTDELREDTTKLSIELRAKRAKCGLRALVVRRLNQHVLVHNLQQTSGLPAQQEAIPNVTLELESLHKGEKVELVVAIVAEDQNNYDDIRDKSFDELVEYPITPSP